MEYNVTFIPKTRNRIEMSFSVDASDKKEAIAKAEGELLYVGEKRIDYKTQAKVIQHG